MDTIKRDAQIEKAEKIIEEAKFTSDYNDSDVNIYYELKDKIDELKLSKRDKDFYLVRLDVILGQNLK